MVHFYDAEQDLLALVGPYLSTAVLDGDSAIVIATADHRAGFAAEMTRSGLDVDAAERGQSLMMLDADEVLSRFMVGDTPSQTAFESAVGAQIRETVGSGRRVRAYGEMVARLAAQGNAVGALELEGLWNELLTRMDFALFCAYPNSVLAAIEGAETFGAVCGLHTEVLAGAPVPDGADASWRFPRSPEAARRARRCVGAAVSGWELDGLRDAAVLAAAELAANAVLHAHGDFTVSLTRLPDRLRVSVGDTGLEPVAPSRAPTLAVSGRGLAIVSAVADDWGCELQDGGKVVWADFSSVFASSAAG